MKNKTKRSVGNWVVEIITFLCLLWSFYPLCFYHKISAQIPIHYNIYGKVDAWGDRSFFWLLPVIALILYAGISILQKYIPRLNYPVKVIENNAHSLYKLGLGMLQYIKFFVLLIFAYINNTSLSIALGKKDALDNGMFLSLIIVFLLGIVVLIVKMIRLKDRT